MTPVQHTDHSDTSITHWSQSHQRHCLPQHSSPLHFNLNEMTIMQSFTGCMSCTRGFFSSTLWQDACCATLSPAQLNSGAGIAQLAECLTEKPGTTLTRVAVPGTAKDFSPRVNFQRGFSYCICTAPACCRMHRLTSVHMLKIPTLAAIYDCLGIWKHCTYW